MFLAIFEGELGDAGFIELAQAVGDHAVVLLFRRTCERQIEAESARQVERDPTVFRSMRNREKATVLAVFISSPSVSNTREFAPVCENTSRSIVKSKPSAAPRPSPSARPAVLMFITMLTSAFTFAASPALPMNRIFAASSFKIGSALWNVSSFPPHIR